jgi:hypothetical protein
MGMFDTIRLEKPLVCPTCGHGESTLQTHHFDESLSTFRPGMIVPHCPVLSGVLVETFWCSACHNADIETAPELYLVIWHSILVAVEWDRDEAERRLAAVDRLDLIAWLHQAQDEAREWQRKYQALRTDLSRWHEYQEQQAKGDDEDETSRRSGKAWPKSFFLPDEAIRDAADPLAAILDRHPWSEDPDLF